jgi:hypothetical protein
MAEGRAAVDEDVAMLGAPVRQRRMRSA